MDSAETYGILAGGDVLAAPWDRRAFLRRLAALGLTAPTVSAFGCSLEEVQREDIDFAASSLTRPVLLPWTDDAVRIGAPVAALPLAYVSRGLQNVYVDLDSRDEIRMLLAAHISVSSAHWRIPLPGDDLGIPIDAGDALREFEEWPIGEWDPTMDPMDGDFRIRRGHPEKVSVAFDCLPMAERTGWFSAGPWEIVQCVEPGTELCREQFMDVGTGSHFLQRPLGTCAEPAGDVRYVTWACPDP
jgi:hypothetical protein